MRSNKDTEPTWYALESWFFSHFYGHKQNKNIFFKKFFYNKMRSNKATEPTWSALESWDSQLSNEHNVGSVAQLVRNFAAGGRHSWLWPEATTSLKSQKPLFAAGGRHDCFWCICARGEAKGYKYHRWYNFYLILQQGTYFDGPKRSWGHVTYE